MTQDNAATPTNDYTVCVSVIILTYNHKNFIAQAIEGALQQQTSFPYEIIIGEDESQDGTREICVEYAEKRPDLIRLFLRSRKDVIYVDNRPTGRFNLIQSLKAARGKYIAMCEGDDYWTDPHKLQKQVDFLEANPDYGFVHADCDLLYVNNEKILPAANKQLGERPSYNHHDELFDQLVAGTYKIFTPTVMFRTSLWTIIEQDLAEIYHKFLMGDRPMWLEMARHTNFYYMDESVAGYRRMLESASRSNDSLKKLRFELSAAEAKIFFAQKYRGAVPLRLRRKYNRTLLQYKAVEPEYTEMFPLLQPSSIERYFYKHPNPSLRPFIIFWFLLLTIKDTGWLSSLSLAISQLKLRLLPIKPATPRQNEP